MRVCIVMYHYVRDLERSRYPAIKGLDAALFRRQVDFLNAKFSIIRMEDLLGARAGGKLPENAALLTFDDGYIDHYSTAFPVLDEMGLQGSFFATGMVLRTGRLLDVNKVHFILASGGAREIYGSLIAEIDRHRGGEYAIPDTRELLCEYAKPNRFDCGEVIFIKRMLQTALPEGLRVKIADRLFRQFVGVSEEVLAGELYCNAAQLAAMKRHGMHIGLHGDAHGWLGNMGRDEYTRDIDAALGFMDGAGLIDANKGWVMNYPYGSWNSGVVEYLRGRGCIAGLTTEVGAADLQSDDMMLLPRLDTNDFPPKSEAYLQYC